MRIYKSTEDRLPDRIICNCCGKRINISNHTVMEGVCRVETDWGYFSEKDGEHHAFDLCESCYDRIVGRFAVPVEKKELTELM